MFPATFLIITLFRKSRPKNKRPSRVQTALNNTTKRATSMTDVNPTLENTREGTLTPSVLLEQKNRPDTSLSRGYTSLSVGELAEKPSKKKKEDGLSLVFRHFCLDIAMVGDIDSSGLCTVLWNSVPRY